MIPAAELEIMTRQTEAFIDGDYEMITIEPRRTRTGDGAGGWLAVPGSPIAPQKVRLVPQADAVPEVNSLEGRREAPEYVLVAMPDADIQKGDRFDWRGQKWEVTQVHDKPEYELKGDVDLYGRNN